MSGERLFFALWPTEEVRANLATISQQATKALQGRSIPAENLHITLVFIGEVNTTTKHCLQQVAGQVPGQKFTLILDEMEYWPKKQIVWLGARQIPAALQTLVNELTTRLQVCGHRPETRPYQAHITLMRKAQPLTKRLPTCAPIVWPLEDFCLVRSQLDSAGSRYEIIARWPLF